MKVHSHLDKYLSVKLSVTLPVMKVAVRPLVDLRLRCRFVALLRLRAILVCILVCIHEDSPLHKSTHICRALLAHRRRFHVHLRAKKRNADRSAGPGGIRESARTTIAI